MPWPRRKPHSSAKVPESSPENLRLYTIPPSAPFLTTLARAILAGELPLPGGAKPDPLTLPLTTIYLPTRRAGRALRDAFLAEAKGAGMLLPRIRALGDPDEDAAIIFGAGDGGADDGAIATPAIGALHRRLALMRLVLTFGQRLSTATLIEGGTTGIYAMTPGQASHLAADLARLMDFVESEQVSLADLKAIGPEEFAVHWQLTVAFLKILTQEWPRYLADNGLISPVARRTLLMAQETARLAKGSAYPVIAAGSTGTLPATARLLKAIASLPNGAVVLPGLDKQLDEKTWAELGEAPEHPQHGMAAFLRDLGATRDNVAYLPGAEPDPQARARLHLTSEALRPAQSTDRWEQFLSGGDLAARASLANAASGLQLVEAPTAHDEAEAIALILREAVETKGKTAALVTPDRTLARRVAARLKRYELAVDDSAGVPVAHTVPGAFLDLAIGAAETNFAPPALMALLKHPLALLGRSPSDARFAARALERGAFRGVYVGEGLDGARAALDAAKDEERRGPLRLSEREHDAAVKLVADLKAAFAPLTALGAGLTTASRLAEAHAAVGEALARDTAGSSSGLWRGDAGEALSVLLAELIEEGRTVTLKLDEYPEFYRSLVAGEAVRPLLGLHPRLFIWGPLEARLQQPDLMILGSLNEGVWPRPEEAGPWLSRPMRAKLKLPPPERRIGLSAHDFTQALGASEVYLTRALKVDGVPTVPSRWLQRLLALTKAAGIESKLAPADPWVAWARERDRTATIDPAKPPKPRPPLEARPRKLSVTRIERWIANPYEIFAKDILNLEPLKELGAEPDAALRGEIVHRALQQFSRDYRDDIEEALVAIADEHFAVLAGSPVVKAFWRPAFRRFARWFAATEPGRRQGLKAMLIEAQGSLDLGNDFRLTARADRIDIAENGSAAIYDYKTGRPPAPSRVAKLVAPQLPLEALIAAEGGFPGLDKCAVSKLSYIQVSGRGEGGEERDAGERDPETLASEARAKLIGLIAHYADPDVPYEVKRRSGPFRDAYKYDPYEHLARIKEWLTQEAEEEFG
jgi:double-strand break repair protein AddB